MEPIELGKTEGFKGRICVSSKAPNSHLLVVGMTGSGKTVALQKIEKSIAKNGGCVVILDYGVTHVWDKSDVDRVEFTSVHQDGMPFWFFKPIVKSNGKGEQQNDVLEAVAEAFGNVGHMGIRQKRILRDALSSAIKNTEMNDVLLKVADILKKEYEEDGENISGKFRKIFSRLHFCEMPLSLEDGKIYDIDFSGYDAATQWMLAELSLSWLWRYAQLCGRERRNGIFVVCDEFQNLDNGETPLIAQILREGRRNKLSLLLATQTLAGFERSEKIILEQAATQLFFRPTESEIVQTAKLLDEKNSYDMGLLLRGLHVGECIGRGRFNVGALTVERALKMTFVE